MSRKFKESAYYQKGNANYYLLPFKFHKINDLTEVLVNEVGEYLFVDNGTANRIINREIKFESNLYKDLISNFFISEKPIPDLIDIISNKYRSKKSFINEFTSLHIFVVSLRCDHTCHYCQVSRVSEDQNKYDMSKSDIDIAISHMLRSKSDHVTMEFQGGEPLLAFDKIKYGVGKAKELNKKYNKEITFVICTNLVSVTKEILNFCKEHNILISTSYDGPQYIHDKNRLYTKGSSHKKVLKGIDLSRKILGHDRVSALMTTTNLTLDYPLEIIDDYYKNGFRNIFLRPISPYGFALKSPKKNKYVTEKFLEFYKKGLMHIIDMNKKGIYFSEDYATIILKKILTPFPVGYVDLQSPAGAINSVIVYNYDGYVYATDESRMLAETGDYSFRLGHLKKNSYEEIFFGKNASKFAYSFANESLPGCSECGLQAYCGADPVFHHASQGDVIGHRPSSGYCQKNMNSWNFMHSLNK